MFFFSRRFQMFLTPQKILSTQFLTSHVPYDKCSGPKPINTKKTPIGLIGVVLVAFTDQPKIRFNNTTVLIKHSKKWWSYSLCTCLLPNKEIPNMDIHYIPLQLNKDIHNL